MGVKKAMAFAFGRKITIFSHFGSCKEGYSLWIWSKNDKFWPFLFGKGGIFLSVLVGVRKAIAFGLGGKSAIFGHFGWCKEGL